MDELFHHRMARKISMIILSKMLKDPLWNPGIFDVNGLRLGSIPNTWPLADASLFDDNTKKSIGIEFKPPSESKRGCLTGLGQALAYLNLFSCSILVVPETTEDGFQIGDFIAFTINNNQLERVPIAVVTYPIDANPEDKDINLQLKSGFKNREISKVASSQNIRVDSTFYVNWRDTSPHEVFLFLDISDGLDINFQGHRLNKIWDIYWREFYCPKEALETLNNVESNVYQFDYSTKRISLKKTKEIIRKKVGNGEVSYKEALRILNEKASPGKDTNYVDLRKNHYNFMNQLKLWDNRGVLTSVGATLHSIGKRKGWDSSAFYDALAHLVFVHGDHLTLVYEFEDFLMGHDVSKFSNVEEIRQAVIKKLDDEHLIKRNPNRATTNDKKAFQDEFTLWNHFGVLLKNGRTYFDDNRGIILNWKRINSIVNYNFKI